MFKIHLIDIGMDKVSKEVITHVDTFDEAENIAYAECQKILCYSDFNIQEVMLRTYAVTKCKVPVGIFTIRCL